MVARMWNRSGPAARVLSHLFPKPAACLLPRVSRWQTTRAILASSQPWLFGEPQSGPRRQISAQAKGGLAVSLDDVVLVEFHEYSELDGNQRFGKLVERYQHNFGIASGMSKSLYPGYILDEWRRRNPQGRFLKADGDGWVVIGEAEALEWISWWLLYLRRPASLPPRVKRRAQNFVNSLVNAEYEQIEEIPSMRVLRNLPTLQGRAEKVDIVVRDIVEKYWKACIDKVTTPSQNIRVAAIGTQGIGKTFTTPILMHMLLEKGHTVVYLVKSRDGRGWYYEFCRNSDGTCAANIYPENTREEDIASLGLESTFYIVDPGDSKSVDCNPMVSIKARVILVTAPDCRWGESMFPRDRLGVMGVFMCYPLWSLAELVAARHVIDPTCENTDVVRRYQLFGGVPANIFVPAGMFAGKEMNLLRRQRCTLSSLSVDQLYWMSTEKINELECFNPESRLSMVTAFDLRRDGNGQCTEDFEHFVVVPVSEVVKEEAQAKLLQALWTGRSLCQRGIFQTFVKPLVKRVQK
jgi:hypothetical protein